MLSSSDVSMNPKEPKVDIPRTHFPLPGDDGQSSRGAPRSSLPLGMCSSSPGGGTSHRRPHRKTNKIACSDTGPVRQVEPDLTEAGVVAETRNCSPCGCRVLPTVAQHLLGSAPARPFIARYKGSGSCVFCFSFCRPCGRESVWKEMPCGSSPRRIVLLCRQGSNSDASPAAQNTHRLHVFLLDFSNPWPYQRTVAQHLPGAVKRATWSWPRSSGATGAWPLLSCTLTTCASTD